MDMPKRTLMTPSSSPEATRFSFTQCTLLTGDLVGRQHSVPNCRWGIKPHSWAGLYSVLMAPVAGSIRLSRRQSLSHTC